MITSFSPEASEPSSTGHVAGDVEERDDQDEHRRAGAAGGLLGPAQGVDRALAAEAHEGLDDRPVGGHRALGVAGGARRVEDGGVVVGVDRHARGSAPGTTTSSQRSTPRRARRRRRRRTPMVGMPRRAAASRVRSTRSTSATSTLAPGVLEPVVQLVGRPPGVHRHHDGADRQGAEVGDDPLGVVAHGDGDPVALRHAVALLTARRPGRRRGRTPRRRCSARPRRPGTRCRRSPG